MSVAGLPRAPREAEVDGISYGEWPGDGELPAVVCLHGISSNHRSFLHVAPRLAPHRVVAPDLRGRGRSRRDGPFGIVQHAVDVTSFCDALGLEHPVVAGHSLGAYVAVEAAALGPGRFRALALLDGGAWPPWVVPDDVIDFLLAPSLGRLGRRFASLEDYEAYWERSPLHLRTTPERRSQHALDLIPDGDGFRPATDPAVFERDSRDLLRHPQRNALLGRIAEPMVLIRAGRGMTGDPSSALVPDVSVADARRHAPALAVVDLARANHYELLDPPNDEAIAAAVLRLAA